MNRLSKDQRFFFFVAVFAIFLISCVHGLVVLPVWSFRGLDLQNFHAFHTNCGGWPISYRLTGAECGDPLGRGMIYPPLIYWSMSWVRFFDFYRADLVWSLAILLFTVWGTVILAGADPRRDERSELRNGILYALLFLHLPMAYALERGNCDALVIPIYCAAIFFFCRRKFSIAGVLFATAAWLKVYPAIPALMLLAACGLEKDLRKKVFKPLALGFLGGGLAWAVVLLPDSYRYVVSVLPKLTDLGGGFQPYTHTLYKGPSSWIFLKLPILLLWGRMTLRYLKRDPAWILAGGLAISTFFQNLTNDYSFITAYPFLYLTISRILRPQMRGGDPGALILTFLVYVGDRAVWTPLFGNRGVLYWQVIWLVFFPLFIDRFANRRVDKGLPSEGNLLLL